MAELNSSEKKKLAELLLEKARRIRENKLAHFKPYKFQKNFYSKGKDYQHRLMMAANRVGKCVMKSTTYELPNGNTATMEQLFNEGKAFNVFAWDGNNQVVAKAHAPFSKGMHECYEFTMQDGTKIGVADHHRVLLKNGNYCFAEDLYAAHKIQMNSVQVEFYGELNVAHHLQTPPNLTEGCLKDSHQYDAQLRQWLANVLGCPRQQVDALDSNSVYQLVDALELSHSNSLDEMFCRPSMLDYLRRNLSQLLGQYVEFLSSLLSKFAQSLSGCNLLGLQHHFASNTYPQSSCESHQYRTCFEADGELLYSSLNRSLQQTPSSSQEALQFLCGVFHSAPVHTLHCNSYSSPMILNDNPIVAVNSIGCNEVYDFEVEEHHNYIACSMVHHNSYSGAMEVAYHATGLYPDWWDGLRFDHAVKIICGGQTTERARDIVQKELLGEPSDPAALGTGAIPKDCIVSVVRRAGIPNAISSILVKNKFGGNTKINIQSYESGKEAWMGDNAHFVWLDEEPPDPIYSQALRSMVDLEGHLMMTFTPENGVTEIVRKYMQEIKEHQFLLNATWDDAPHITEMVKKQMLATLSPHERDMRMKGLPMIGEGLVYSLDEALISIEPFKLPEHWRKISGIDFGFDHATAWVNMSYDAETDVLYLTEAVKIRQTVIPEIASILKRKGADKIPVAWPHDGLKHDSWSGRTVRDMYEQEGIKMLPEKFTNPPSPGMMEGTGGIGIEAGVASLRARMETGRFRVFNTCTDWFNEFRLYHRKNGKIVDRNDDLMAATRYAGQSLRFAKTMNATYRSYIPPVNDFADSLVAY